MTKPGPSEATPSTAGSVREALDDLRDFVASSRQHEIDLELRDQILRKVTNIKFLSAPVEAPVVVKPLIWREHKGDEFCFVHYDADAIGGSYSIEERKNGPFDLWMPNNQTGRYASLDAAKAAAQADYEQRIRSALIATPHPLPSVDELAETVHKARWPADRQMAITPFADADDHDREYCRRIATAILTLGGSAHAR